MAKKKVTIETLAQMVSKGFSSVENKMATKADMDLQFKEVNKRLDRVEGRLDRVESLLTTDYKRRVERLEMDMKELKGLIGMK